MNSQRDPIRSHARQTVAARRVGKDVRCKCGETRPEALITGSKPVICAACQRRKKGQTDIDFHHIEGRKNSPLIAPVNVNDHRAILTPAQFDWPKFATRNRNARELIEASQSLWAVINYIEYLLNRLLRPRAEQLERLAQEVNHRGRNKK